MAKGYEKCMLNLVEYKSTSTVGNPSYWVCFVDSEGKLHRGYTGSNSSSGYTIKNYRHCGPGTVIYMEYHFASKTGSCIVDYIKHNTPEGASREAEAEEVKKQENSDPEEQHEDSLWRLHHADDKGT